MSQRHRVQNYNFSSVGAMREQGAIAPALLALGGGGVNAPTLASLNPATAVHGAGDVTLHCIGTNFTTNSKIIYNGVTMTTTHNSATDIQCMIPVASQPGAAGLVPVAVQTGPLSTGPLNFTWT